jgi:hypothetical protein
MPVTTLNPLSVGSFNVWTNSGGADKMASTRTPDDDDTSFVTLTGLSGTSRQSFNMDQLPANAKAIQTHTAVARLRRTTTSVLTLVNVFLAQTAGAQITSGTAAQPALTYADRSEVDLASPNGAAAWTVALINATEVGIINSSVGADEDERCTTIRWLVTWQPDNSGFAAFVGALIGGLGASIGAHMMEKIARQVAVSTRGKHRLTPEDLNILLQSLRTPVRRYCF